MKTNKQKLFNSKNIVRRIDGRLELTCSHGVGHPSKLLHSGKWHDDNSIHGCDGCCSDPLFHETEKKIEKNKWMKLKKKETVDEDKTNP